jgi:hypothetical protein
MPSRDRGLLLEDEPSLRENRDTIEETEDVGTLDLAGLRLKRLAIRPEVRLGVGDLLALRPHHLLGTA